MTTATLEVQDVKQDIDAPLGLDHYDEAVENVRGKFVGVRIKIGKAPQTAQWDKASTRAALNAVDGADEDSVTLSAKLLDPRIESVAAVNDVIAKINDVKMDRRYTLPYTRPGLRLVKMGDANLNNLVRLDEELSALKVRLAAAAEVMYYDMDHIRRHMRAKLKEALYNAKNYDFDPRLRYNLDWGHEDVDVPSYLKHNKELEAQAERDVQIQMRESVFLAEQQMAEGIFFIVDHLIERLEGRRLFDQKHEIKDVQKLDDGSWEVTYREKNAKKPITVVLEDAEYNLRVSEDSRQKQWNATTAEKLFDEVEFAEKQASDIGLGKGQLADAFARLKTMLGSTNKKTLVKSLKENGDFRDHFRGRMESLGDQLLDVAVLKGKRDIVRSRSGSKKFNPQKV